MGLERTGQSRIEIESWEDDESVCLEIAEKLENGYEVAEYTPLNEQRTRTRIVLTKQ